jgi:polysaccharide deacetylase family protein (PEP-CTERM system associated)
MAPDRAAIINGLSVDVEEHFQVQAFADCIPRSAWNGFPSRVENNVGRLLDLFAARGVHGTFFVLAWIAERHPGLIRRIVDGGHELASHGCEHIPVYAQSPAEFHADAARSKAVLEDIGGRAVLGYRAASFSIIPASAWAFAELERVGYRYSSSMVPVRHDLYGFPGAPRFRHHPIGTTQLLECPASTVDVGGRLWACGGGGYFRLFPYAVYRWALRRLHASDGQPCLFYLHPWEIDPEQPRVPGAKLRSRFRHYVNLARTESRLQQLLRDFRWGRYDRVLGLPVAA